MPTAAVNPTHIGRYEITGVIGRGGMGIVYKGLDPRIGRAVAIKVLTSSFDQGESLARFYREAKYTGSLQHHNIVTLYELGDQDGFPYLVMEYLEGRGLDAIINSDANLSIAEKLNIMGQVCRGLSFAHGRGIVHRDIKPANIVVLEDGTAKIVDFGIAHVGGNRLTRTGLVMGSIFYMSPEQLNGNVELDVRTDIFSAGIVLFELLTGALPFQGQDTGSTLLKIVNEPPPRLAKYLSSVPSELEPIIARALAKRREERYSSADEFGFELRQLQQQLSREQVASQLQCASKHIEERDFDAARQALIHVLRLDPDNTTGKQRLADVQREIDLQKRKQAALELRSRAEEALREKRFDAAKAMVEEALQSQPDDIGLKGLREAIKNQQEAARTYDEALDRAAAALNAGALDRAKKAMEDALAVQSLDTRGRALGDSIAQQMQEQARREKVSEEARQVAIAVNLVEKAIADARMFLFFNQRQEAREALVGAMGSALRVPQELRTTFEALCRELEREPESQETLTDKPPAFPSATLSDRPEPFSATVALQSRTPPEKAAGNEMPAYADPAIDSWTAPSSESENTGIPEELREFLPPPQSNWHRFALGATVIIFLAAGALYLFVFRSKTARVVETPHAIPSVAREEPYAEINAEPWGKITAVTSRRDQLVIKPNEVTPTRLSLQSGQYEVTITGPNGQIRKLQIEVPQQGGESYFVVFTKPDIDRMLGTQSSQ